MSACVILVYYNFQYILFPLIKEFGDFTFNVSGIFQSRGQKRTRCGVLYVCTAIVKYENCLAMILC